METTHSTEHSETPPTVVQHEVLETNAPRPPVLSWGAVAGGLVFIVAASWLMYLLGAAIGVSVADVSDGEAVGTGFGIGSIIWMILSSLVTFFIGSMLTARLSGEVDSNAGMLHGLTLWGVATVLMLVMSYYGLSTLVSAAYTGISGVAAVAGDAGAGVASAGSAAASAVANADEIALSENIQARLKRRAAKVLARSEKPGGESVSTDEVESAIEDLDPEDLEEIATQVAMGEMTSAKETLAEATNLNQEEVTQILRGLENEFEERLGTDGNDTGLATDISKSLKSNVSEYVADLDAKGGPDVTSEEIDNAIEDLDSQTLQTVSMRVISGNPQSAKDVLAANTSLSTREINDVVDGVEADVSRKVEAYQEAANEAAEAASTYAQAVLWSLFIAGAIGMVACMLGGWLGVESTRRIDVEKKRVLA